VSLGDRWAPVDWTIGKWNDRQPDACVNAMAMLPWDFDGVTFFVVV